MQVNLRHFVTAMALTAIMVSCKKDDTTSTGGNSTTNPDPIDVTSCASATGINKIICLAEAFKAQLDASQLATVQRTYSKTEAQKWSNLPQGLVQSANKRIGLNFGAMDRVFLPGRNCIIRYTSAFGLAG